MTNADDADPRTIQLVRDGDQRPDEQQVENMVELSAIAPEAHNYR